jgi:membrane glycosyltransferase
MKLNWGIILGLLLLDIASVSFLIYLLSQGAVLSVPLLLLIWGIVVLDALVGWLVGWTQATRKQKS